MKTKLSLIQKIREIAVLIRIQQLGTSITAVIGGLTVKGFNLDFFDFLLLFIIGMIVNIGGQVHNDIIDYDIDKRSKELKERPLVKGTVSCMEAKISFKIFSAFFSLCCFKTFIMRASPYCSSSGASASASPSLNKRRISDGSNWIVDAS